MNRKPVAAVLLADQARSSELAMLLEMDGIHAIVLSNTDDFHQTLNRECIDLAIVENGLRGFLSGIEILERMYRDLVRPATLLLTEPSVDVDRRARRLGIDRFFSAHVPLDELVRSAKSVVASGLRERVVIPPEARKLVSDIDFINPLPQLLVKLASYFGRDDEDLADELAKDISVDARVTAELLKLTNSSAMGRPLKTTSVVEAVRFLGVRRTVTMVLSAGIFRAQAPILKTVSPSLRTWYNCRSVLISSTASAFASLEDISQSTAYLLGLMQDIGTLVLAHVYGDRYDQLLDRVRQIHHLRREQVEAADLQTTHAEVSAALLQKWEMPPSLITMVLRHHESAQVGERPSVEQAFARVMQIGERVADLSDRRSSKRYLELNETLSVYGRGRADECKVAIATAVAQAVESSKLFHVPMPDQATLNALVVDLRKQFDSIPNLVAEPGDAPESKPSAEAVSTSESHVGQLNAASVAQGAEPTAEVQLAKSRLLIIDDEPGVRAVLRRFVSDLNVECIECSLPDDAYRLAKDVDLVFCDVHLGDADGRQVVEQIRASGYTGKILMMSGDSSRSLVVNCIGLGIDGYLAKPFTRDMVVQKVQQHLAMRATKPKTSQ